MTQIDIEKWTKEHRKQEKRNERRKKLRRYKEQAIGFAESHPVEAIACVGTVIGGIFGVTKGIIKNMNLHKQERIKNDYCYDRSLGHYWKLRRELTNDEWLAIDQRKAKGERLADILEDLKVLK